MSNTLKAVGDIVTSFRGKEMSHDQNMAVFNLIESVLGEQAANVFARCMDSSDEKHDRATTYTYRNGVQNIWTAILQAGLKG